MAKWTPNQREYIKLAKQLGVEITERSQLPKRITKQYLADYKQAIANYPIRGEMLFRRFNGFIMKFHLYPFGYFFSKWWNEMRSKYNRNELIGILELAEKNLSLDEQSYYDSDVEKMRNEVDYIAYVVESAIPEYFSLSDLGDYGGIDEI